MSDIEVVTQLPRRVREIENAFIPLADGTRLAARIWLPEDAESDPVPAILEYLPYRKRDGTVDRDALTHPYLAGHGYACLRVDMRGTGDSEGICRGEYLSQEQDDALGVLDWIAKQPWCSGRAGMIGISWGGFNGLQVAARQHPALQAVISLCSTDDRYADDIHFMGGALLTDKVAWGATAFTIAMTPPDPAIVGEEWRALWKQRLERNGLWLIDWFRHQRRDDFYRHGSICEDWSKVTTPVYAVGGWADGYTNAIFRMMQHLPGPKKALIGPWAHKYPHFAKPGPRVGFLQECVRWWDHWLKDRDTGMMDEPMIRAWIEEPTPPAPTHDEVPGRWVAETAWPGPGVEQRSYTLSGAQLVAAGADAAPDEPVVLSSPQTTGFTAGSWCNYGAVPDSSLDQREEPSGSLIFETQPLGQDVDILGFPLLEAVVASDRPNALLAATLSAVAPDGAATRVSYGILNLTHRDSHAEPEPLEPGQAVRVTLQLNACGQRFAAGMRIRLALSTAYWPVVFPSPEAASLTLQPGQSRLVLPVRPLRDSDRDLPPLPAPEGAAPLERTVLRKGGYARRLTRDLVAGTQVYDRIEDNGRLRHEHTGIEFESKSHDRFSIHPDDPATARAASTWLKAFRRGDWDARVETSVSVEALAQAWRIRGIVEAYTGGELFHSATWEEDVPRDLV